MSAADEVEAVPFPVEEEDVQTATPEATQSIFDQLRAQRQKAARDHRVDLAVPGWAGQLVLRMGPIEPRRMKSLMDRARSSNSPDPEQAERYNADLIILATREVIFRANGSDQVMADDTGPIGIDSRLAEGLGIEAKTAREVIYGLFARANDRAIAIGSFAQQWIEWAQSADEEVDEAFLGESPGTTT